MEGAQADPRKFCISERGSCAVRVLCEQRARRAGRRAGENDIVEREGLLVDTMTQGRLVGLGWSVPRPADRVAGVVIVAGEVVRGGARFAGCERGEGRSHWGGGRYQWSGGRCRWGGCRLGICRLSCQTTGPCCLAIQRSGDFLRIPCSLEGAEADLRELRVAVAGRNSVSVGLSQRPSCAGGRIREERVVELEALAVDARTRRGLVHLVLVWRAGGKNVDDASKHRTVTHA